MAAATEDEFEEKSILLTNSIESALDSVREYELRTTSKFSVRKTEYKDFGHTAYAPNKKYKVLWEEVGGKGLSFNGKPFFFLNSMYLDCAHGPERHANFKKTADQKMADFQKQDHAQVKRKVQYTKKVDCPAFIQLKEVIFFPEYQISQNTYARRTLKSKVLRDDLKNGRTVVQERKIIVHFPNQQDHENHITGEKAGFLQPIDKALKEKIKELVADLVTDTSEIKWHLSQYVENVLFRDGPFPDKSNRRFYPTDIDVRNHVTLALKRLRESSVEQEQVANVCPDHSPKCPNNFVFLRAAENIKRTTCNILILDTETSLMGEPTKSIESCRKNQASSVFEGENFTESNVAHDMEAASNSTACAEDVVNQDTKDLPDIHRCVPSKKLEPPQLNKLANLCRGKLTDIRTKTYEVHKSAILEELNFKLQDLNSWLSQELLKDKNNLALLKENIPVVSEESKDCTKETASKLSDESSFREVRILPLDKKQKLQNYVKTGHVLEPSKNNFCPMLQDCSDSFVMDGFHDGTVKSPPDPTFLQNRLRKHTTLVNIPLHDEKERIIRKPRPTIKVVFIDDSATESENVNLTV